VRQQGCGKVKRPILSPFMDFLLIAFLTVLNGLFAMS
jgi:hypothetical protein